MASARRAPEAPPQDTNDQPPPAPPQAREPIDGAAPDAEGGAPATPPPADPEPPKGRKGYFVAPGRSVTTKRGSLGEIMTPGAEVFPDDFYEGQKDLDVLVKNGHVLEKK